MTPTRRAGPRARTRLARLGPAAALVSCGLALAAWAGGAQAQEGDYPQAGKQIAVIVGSSAGGGMDLTARLAADALERELEGSSFQINNRPGAGTQVGVQAIADATPDGYSMGVISLPTAATLSLDEARQANFDRDSFAPVANFVFDPGAIAVQADSEYQTLEDLVAAAKERPGEVTIGVTGPRGREHLDVIGLEQASGAKFTPVFHDDSGLALNSLLGGNIDAVQGSVADFLAQMEGGRVRLLAVFDRQPSELAPDVPTAESLGYPIYSGVTRGFAFPAGVPESMIQTMSDALGAVAQSPEEQEKVRNMGFELRYMDAEEFARHWEDEVERVKNLTARLDAQSAHPPGAGRSEAGAGPEAQPSSPAAGVGRTERDAEDTMSAIPTIAAETLAFYRTASSSLVTDGLARMGLGSWMDDVLPLDPAWQVSGRVRTVLFAPRTGLKRGPHSIYTVGAELAPGGVMVIATGGTRSWLLGENIAHFALYRELRGIVTDSRVRDANELRELGFPVFCRGVSARPPHLEIELVAWDVPVQCGGGQLRSGDLIVGDADGVAIVPYAAAGALRIEVDDLKALEQEQEEAIRARVPVSEIQAISRRKKVLKGPPLDRAAGGSG